MTIVLVGLNHRTAPVALREKLSLTGEMLQTALGALKTGNTLDHQSTAPCKISEGVILSTCNRLEVYAVVEGQAATWTYLDQFLASVQHMAVDVLHPHLYHFEGQSAVNHLMQVTCGLNSMILGETQILGQVTQAFEAAQRSHLTGPVLSQLMSQAIHAGKRARTETDISRHTTSVSHAAARMVEEKCVSASPNVLIVGAGDVAYMAAKALHHHGMTSLSFINRTYSRGASLAQEFGGLALPWGQLVEGLVWADAVITATGAPHTVIHQEDVCKALSERDHRELLLVDIAVPRDVAVDVDDVVGVQRYDIDDLQAIVDKNAAQRESAVPKVEAIIAQQIQSFTEWSYSREVSPVIKDLRQWATDIAKAEVEQALNKLGDADPQTSKIINRLAHRLVNKILHEPTMRLRGQATEGNGYAYAHTVSELFGLQASDHDAEQEAKQSR